MKSTLSLKDLKAIDLPVLSYGELYALAELVLDKKTFGYFTSANGKYSREQMKDFILMLLGGKKFIVTDNKGDQDNNSNLVYFDTFDESSASLYIV